MCTLIFGFRRLPPRLSNFGSYELVLLCSNDDNRQVLSVQRYYAEQLYSGFLFSSGGVKLDTDPGTRSVIDRRMHVSMEPVNRTLDRKYLTLIYVSVVAF